MKRRISIKRLDEKERLSWLQLMRSENVSRNVFFYLLEMFGSASEALGKIQNYSMKGGLKKPIRVFDRDNAVREFEACKKVDAQIVTYADPEYPQGLREISDPPPILTVRGNVNLLSRNIMAIVGPRNSSINGCKFATNLASQLGDRGFIIASGMARGIDTAAHHGSLDTGTIAIIAGSVDHIYPRENHDLYYRIAKDGLVATEMAFGTVPRGGNFPQRNRIISGISLGVIIVGGTLRSGTLVTARCAIEQNREVFAVPGSPFDPRSQGSNRLIKEGATLVESIDDILREVENLRDIRDGDLFGASEKGLGAFRPSHEDIPNDNEIDHVRDEIIASLSFTPIALDEIIERLDIKAQLVIAVAIQLSLAGRANIEGGKISLLIED